MQTYFHAFLCRLLVDYVDYLIQDLDICLDFALYRSVHRRRRLVRNIILFHSPRYDDYLFDYFPFAFVRWLYENHNSFPQDEIGQNTFLVERLRNLKYDFIAHYRLDPTDICDPNPEIILREWPIHLENERCLVRDAIYADLDEHLQLFRMPALSTRAPLNNYEVFERNFLAFLFKL